MRIAEMRYLPEPLADLQHPSLREHLIGEETKAYYLLRECGFSFLAQQLGLVFRWLRSMELAHCMESEVMR